MRDGTHPYLADRRVDRSAELRTGDRRVAFENRRAVLDIDIVQMQLAVALAHRARFVDQELCIEAPRLVRAGRLVHTDADPDAVRLGGRAHLGDKLRVGRAARECRRLGRWRDKIGRLWEEHGLRPRLRRTRNQVHGHREVLGNRASARQLRYGHFHRPPQYKSRFGFPTVLFIAQDAACRYQEVYAQNAALAESTNGWW